jgi:hypothetical protein
MFGTHRPVGDSAAQGILIVNDDDSEGIGAQPGEVDRGEHAAKSAADDNHGLHGEKAPMP